MGSDGDDALAPASPIGYGSRVYGGNGADVLTGGGVADLLDGGAGDDRLLARDGVRDTLVCGEGDDSFDADEPGAAPDGGDDVGADCETRLAAPGQAPGPEPAPLPDAGTPPPAAWR